MAQKDIVVTIPAKDRAKIEAEEADVAQREAKGESNIEYYWEMSQLPKESPRRIYFVWGGAVRAYHDVVRMERSRAGGRGRIYMETKIHPVRPTIPMAGFRGFRYIDAKHSEGPSQAELEAAAMELTKKMALDSLDKALSDDEETIKALPPSLQSTVRSLKTAFNREPKK